MIEHRLCLRMAETLAVARQVNSRLALSRDGGRPSIPTSTVPRSRQRTAGGLLFARLQRGDIIIAAKLDRLFRTALDALKVVESLKTRGIKLYLLDLGGDIFPAAGVKSLRTGR
jgi:hypothetical protein